MNLPGDSVGAATGASPNPSSSETANVPSPALRVLSGMRDYAALILTAILIVVLSVASPFFLTSTNLLNIVGQQAPVAIIATAVTIVIITGNFDLSTGSIVAVTNVAAAKVVVNTGSVWMGIGSALILGLLLGIVNGLVITVLRVHAFLATLATSLVYSALALLLTNGSLIPIDNEAFTTLGRGSWGPFTIASLVLVGWVAVAIVTLNRTVIGRHIFAVGGNPEAAMLSGVRVNFTYRFTFAISGLASGMAGAILVSRVSSGQPTQGSDLTLTAIAAVILGGTSIYGGAGAIWRSLVGVYLLALIGNGFNLLGANQFYKALVTGVVIVSAVALAAAGRRR